GAPFLGGSAKVVADPVTSTLLVMARMAITNARPTSPDLGFIRASLVRAKVPKSDSNDFFEDSTAPARRRPRAEIASSRSVRTFLVPEAGLEPAWTQRPA